MKLVYLLSIQVVLVTCLKKLCEDYLDGQNWIIHDGIVCQVERDFEYTISTLQINGLMIIKGNMNHSIKYEEMKFGTFGKLIIEQPYNETDKIEFQQLSQNEICDPSKLLSIGNIQVDYLNTPVNLELKKSAYSNEIKIQLKNSIISTIGQILLINFDQELFYMESLKVSYIEGDTVYLEEPIKYNYIVYNDPIVPNPRILIQPYNNQIIFNKQFNFNYFLPFKYQKYQISSCLISYITSLQGVTFRNFQYLKLIGEQIKGCSFIIDNDQISQYNPQTIVLASNFINNLISAPYNNLTIKSEGKFMIAETTIINTNNIYLKNVNQFKKNAIINSKLITNNSEIEFSSINLIDQNVIKNSQINIENESIDQISFSDCILINSIFNIKYLIRQFEITDSQVINTSFYFLSISQQITINSINVYNTQQSDLIRLQYQLLQQSPLEISIENSHFQIQEDYLIKNQLIGVNLNQDQDEPNYTIIHLFNNTFKQIQHPRVNVTSLFQVEQKLFSYKSEFEIYYLQTNIEFYNKFHPYLLSSDILSLPQNKQMSIYNPSYYSITDPKFNEDVENYSILVQQNNQYLTRLLQNRGQIQTMAFTVQQVSFQDTNYNFINPKEFNLTISNYKINQKLDQFGRYIIVIKFYKSQMRQAIVQYSIDEDIIYQDTLQEGYQELLDESKIKIRKQIQKNQIEIQWHRLIKNKIQIHFQIEFCQQDYFFYKNQCLIECPEYLSGLFCDDKCQDGFINVRQNICKQCPSNCQICKDENTCQKCQDFYFLDDGLCVDRCSKSQYFYQNQCFDCIRDCNICNTDNTSKKLKCFQCEYTQQCQQTNLNCNQSCSKCLGETKFDCLECNYTYQNQFGACIQ